MVWTALGLIEQPFTASVHEQLVACGRRLCDAVEDLLDQSESEHEILSDVEANVVDPNAHEANDVEANDVEANVGEAA